MRAWTLALLAIGCSCQADPPPVCRGVCRNDPDTRCLQTTQCHNDRDCPTGTTCHTPGLGWCVAVDERQDVELALIAGFGVEELDLQFELSASTALVSWEGPARTGVVRCALFGCVPEVVTVSGDQDADDSRATILNYDKCVLAETTGTGPNGTFDLTPGVPALVSSQHGTLVCADGPYAGLRRHLSDLMVGCWAYDETSLIAASRLAPLEPAGLDDLEQTIPSNADCPRDFDDCYDPMTRAFGTCYLGSCRERCVVRDPAVDCYPDAELCLLGLGTCPDVDAGVPDAMPPDAGILDAGPLDASPPDAQPRAWECVAQRPNELVGVCVDRNAPALP